ncbi:MAG: hypothetical protein ACYSYM_11605, partial [Planctomycetota bacterium]
RTLGLGYTSEWAKKNFDSVAEKNKFFEELGSSLPPRKEGDLSDLNDDVTAQEILDKVARGL